MDAVTPQATGRPLTEALLRVFALLTLGFLVWNVMRHWWADPSRITLLVLLVAETYTLMLVLFARMAVHRDLSLVAISATTFAAFYAAFFRYEGTVHLLSESAATVLQMAGLAVQAASKVALGRSFGLLPASRKLVTAGPYRLVRHPIYLGYLISHLGFLLGNFHWQNLAVLALLYACQVVRMRREEQVMCGSEWGPAYRDYREQVRWRIVPYVY